MLRITIIVVAIFVLALTYYQMTASPTSTLSNTSNQPTNQESAKSSEPLDVAKEQLITKPEQSTLADKSNLDETKLSLTPDEKQAAQQHLNTITEQPKETIEALTAQHFVRGNQLIQLPQLETATAQIKAELGAQIPDPSQPTANTFGVSVQTFKPLSDKPSSELSTTKLVTEQQPTTNIATISEATSVKLPNKITVSANKKASVIQLKELIDQPDEDHEQRFFYIHAVNTKDEQGLWGIIQGGLTETFSKGITLPQVGKESVQAAIPQQADEQLGNRQSSFLGQLLHNKVESTYNYRQGLLGQNPDLIKPGQQLIIVSFTESELMRVYQHFTH